MGDQKNGIGKDKPVAELKNKTHKCQLMQWYNISVEEQVGNLVKAVIGGIWGWDEYMKWSEDLRGCVSTERDSVGGLVKMRVNFILASGLFEFYEKMKRDECLCVGGNLRRTKDKTVEA